MRARTGVVLLILFAGFSLAPAAADHPGSSVDIWHYPPDVVSGTRMFEEAPAPALPSEGSHIVVHFSKEERAEDATILYLEDPEGEPILHIYIDDLDGHAYASDGYQEDGSPRAPVDLGWVPRIHPSRPDQYSQRLDVLLQGDQYTVAYDHASASVTLRTFHPASVGRDAYTTDITPYQAVIHRVSYYSDAVLLENFAKAGGGNGWSRHGPAEAVVVEDHILGHQSAGRVHITSQPNLEDLVYLHAPVDVHDGRYLAEASFRPGALTLVPGGVPDHQAVIAGLAGPLDEPTVVWAFAMAPVEPRYDRWSLYHLDVNGTTEPVAPSWVPDSGGTRTQAAPTWAVGYWRAIRVFVDEPAGALSVQLHDEEVVKVFDGALPASDRVAVGDVWEGHHWWTGGNTGYYDNLAVSPWEADP